MPAVSPETAAWPCWAARCGHGSRCASRTTPIPFPFSVVCTIEGFADLTVPRGATSGKGTDNAE